MKKHVWVILAAIFPVLMYGQTDSINKSLNINIQHMGFVKNNEYFNHIADGYTLLGTQLIPALEYHPHNKLSLHAGIFLQKNWGTDSLAYTIPVFRLSYSTKSGEFTLGMLENSDRHQLIEPLMGMENLLDDRKIETGLQYRFQNKAWKGDIWLNWDTFIYKKSPFNEILFQGLSLQYSFLNTSTWKVCAKWQNTFYHRGGQINLMPEGTSHVFTQRHTAFGISLGYNVTANWHFNGQTFFIQQGGSGTPGDLIFSSGYAWYSLWGVSYNKLNIKLGHWYGYHFSSVYGDDMYQSVSRITDTGYANGEINPIHSGYTDPERSLLLGKISYSLSPLKGLSLRLYSGIFYQNYYSNPTPDDADNTIKNHWDYNIGLSVSFTDSVLLWKQK